MVWSFDGLPAEKRLGIAQLEPLDRDTQELARAEIVVVLGRMR